MILEDTNEILHCIKNIEFNLHMSPKEQGWAIPPFLISRNLSLKYIKFCCISEVQNLTKILTEKHH